MHLKFQYTLLTSFLIILIPKSIQGNLCIKKTAEIWLMFKKSHINYGARADPGICQGEDLL